jgi:phage terminase large subunit-like protein
MPLPLYAPRPLRRTFLTYGPACAEWAEREIGLELLKWQRWTLDRMLEVDPATARLRWREVLVSVARRNGKTSLIRAIVGWLLSDECPIWRRSMNAANTRDQALLLFNAIALDMMPLGMEANAAGTRIGIGFPDSDRRHVYVSGRSEGWRGMGQDLVVLDEVQEQRDEDAWAAAEPMIRTAKDGLLVAIGTASTEHAVLFRRLYDRGRIAVSRPEEDPRYAAFVWEAASDDDAGILAANPAVADGLLDMGVLRSTRKSQTPARFASETLNRWISDPTLAWAPPGSWDACGDPHSRAPDARPSFAVDVAPSWARGSIAVAVSDDDAERIHVEIVKDWPETGTPVNEAAVVAEVRRLLAAYPKTSIAYDPQSAIAAAMKRLADEDLPVIAIGGVEFRQACSAFLGHVVSGRLRHLNDPVLNAAARVAARSEDAEAWRFVRRRSAGAIDAICAATMAVALCDRPAPPRPAVW